MDAPGQCCNVIPNLEKQSTPKESHGSRNYISTYNLINVDIGLRKHLYHAKSFQSYHFATLPVEQFSRSIQ